MLFDHALDRIHDTYDNVLDVVTRDSPPILGPVEPIMIPKTLVRVTTFISQNEGQLSSTLCCDSGNLPVGHTEPSNSSSDWGSSQWLTQWCQRLASFRAWDPWRRYPWWQIRLCTNTPTGGNTRQGSSPCVKQHHAITQLTGQKTLWRKTSSLGIPDEHLFTCGKRPSPHQHVLQLSDCRWKFTRRIQNEILQLLLYGKH